MTRVARIIVVGVILTAGGIRAADTGPEQVTAARPTMRQLPAAAAGTLPPTARQLVDARETFAERFREPLSRTRTVAGAHAAAALLLDAAAVEDDRALKWLMLAEARRLAAAAGDAATVDRAAVLAGASYEFDALAEECRALEEIPLRGLDPPRAAGLAGVAEGLATRAEADGRRDVAIDAQSLAIRAWERCGDIAAARRAAARLAEIDPGRIPGRR